MAHSASECVQALNDQNTRILELLNSEELNSETLADMVVERDSLINRCLELLPDGERRAFAEKEYEVNQSLQAKCEELRQQSKESLSKFVKDVKAVRKYR
ncbi:hypothetical protein QTP81_06065 [Alteromonas sp. ASW11-36]|uniref:Flagellar protein FliT n=1 Tax=Alteromonas arenosi TaxID=3055817 RepID=A0ABT7SVD9_9ALTE|nr:hypothetical protein [Alteromonas sp. ASW11-36]MDM7860155.1 hypothetical protein [Alteromonas sp. ASW11-36]